MNFSTIARLELHHDLALTPFLQQTFRTVLVATDLIYVLLCDESADRESSSDKKKTFSFARCRWVFVVVCDKRLVFARYRSWIAHRTHDCQTSRLCHRFSRSKLNVATFKIKLSTAIENESGR